MNEFVIAYGLIMSLGLAIVLIGGAVIAATKELGRAHDRISELQYELRKKGVID